MFLMQHEQMNSVDESMSQNPELSTQDYNLSLAHFLPNEMKIKDNRGSKTNSWLYLNTEPNQFPHILGLK